MRREVRPRPWPTPAGVKLGQLMRCRPFVWRAGELHRFGMKPKVARCSDSDPVGQLDVSVSVEVDFAIA